MFTKKSHIKSISSVVAAAIALSGCALQSDYVKPKVATEQNWSGKKEIAVDAKQIPTQSKWWLVLDDSAINELIDATYANNPTLDQAVARIDEARAQLGINKADYLPNVTVQGGVTRAKSGGVSGTTVATSQNTTASIGPQLSWELDLFGRVRSSVDVAENRLDARTADAENTKLVLGSQVANTVLDLRACQNSAKVYTNEISSRQKTLDLVRVKLNAGFVAPVEEANTQRDLSAAQVKLASQKEVCERNVNALVALSGKNRDEVLKSIAPLVSDNNAEAYMPTPPDAMPELPAKVLMSHPSIIAADRDAAAAWSDIGVAKADQYPRVDLAALFTGQWIRAAGSTINFTSWSIGPNIVGTLFDGGKLSSAVDASEARYRQEAANLQSVVRTTVEEVENALAAQKSTNDRVVFAKQSADAAKIAFTATEEGWKGGISSLLELEDSRRQLAIAQDSVISAARDNAKAWVGLVSATGNAITNIEPVEKETSATKATEVKSIEMKKEPSIETPKKEEIKSTEKPTIKVIKNDNATNIN